MVYPNHRRLKRRAGLAYRRRLRRLVQDCVSGRKDLSDVTTSAQGWVNHARYGDTWGLRRAFFSEIRIRGGTK
jgi:RNA-directed DNA polymerase